MRFDRLASHELVRARILPKSDAGMQAAGMAAAVGAALTLLLVRTIYSLSLAVAVRRQYLACQAGRAATTPLGGRLGSQVLGSEGRRVGEGWGRTLCFGVVAVYKKK